MKVYVDELPKSCSECKHKIRHLQKNFDGTKTPFMTCKFNKKIKHYPIPTYSRWGECPLQSLAEYTKQVRKEVCEEIRNKLKENGLLYTWKGEPKYKTMEELLDQIQGEIK